MDSVFASILAEFNLTAKEDSSCLTLIKKYLINAEQHPTEAKFRRIRKENARFKEVWARDEARNFMLLSGFEEDGDFLVLPDSASCGLALGVLQVFLEGTEGPPATSMATATQPAQPGTLKLSTPATSGSFVPPDMSLLHQMVELGFPMEGAKVALSSTGNRGIPQAVDWLEQHPNWEAELSAAGTSSCPAPVAVGDAVRPGDQPAIAAHTPSQTPPRTESQVTSAASVATTAPEQPSIYIPTKFQGALDARHARAEKQRQEALENARREKLGRKSVRNEVNVVLQVDKENRSRINAERMEEIYRAERMAGAGSGEAVGSGSADQGQLQSDTAMETGSACAVAPVEPIVDRCRLRIRYPSGKAEIFQAAADDSVASLYSHVQHNLEDSSVPVHLTAMHNRCKLVEPDISLRDAGLYPEGSIAVSIHQGNDMKQGSGKVIGMQAVTSIITLNSLLVKQQLSVAVFHRPGHDESEKAMSGLADLRQEVTGTYPKNAKPPAFLSVNFDSARELARHYNVVHVPDVLFFHGRRVLPLRVGAQEKDVVAFVRSNVQRHITSLNQMGGGGLAHHAGDEDDDEEEDDDEDGGDGELL